MKAVSNALILEPDEFRHRGQYRISVSHFAKPFPKGNYVKIEMRSIDNGERILAIFSEATNRYEEGVYCVTTRGQLTFTPPKGLIKDCSSRYDRKYKTVKAAELEFEFK